jgi:hypothetical protein
MRFANRRHGVAAKLLREEDRRLSAARRHRQDVAPAEQYVLMESKFLRRGTRRPDVRSLRRVVAKHTGPRVTRDARRSLRRLVDRLTADCRRRLASHWRLFAGRAAKTTLPTPCRASPLLQSANTRNLLDLTLMETADHLSASIYGSCFVFCRYSVVSPALTLAGSYPTAETEVSDLTHGCEPGAAQSTLRIS